MNLHTKQFGPLDATTRAKWKAPMFDYYILWGQIRSNCERGVYKVGCVLGSPKLHAQSLRSSGTFFPWLHPAGAKGATGAAESQVLQVSKPLCETKPNWIYQASLYTMWHGEEDEVLPTAHCRKILSQNPKIKGILKQMSTKVQNIYKIFDRCKRYIDK